MNLAEVVSASLILMLGCSSSAQLWSQGFRSGAERAQREAHMDRLESLLVASEGTARQLAKTQQPPTTDCQVAAGQLVSHLMVLPLAQDSNPPASLSLPQPPGPGLLHLRWEAGGVQRERLLSLSAVGLCQEGANAA
jgi:hypothetical protein